MKFKVGDICRSLRNDETYGHRVQIDNWNRLNNKYRALLIDDHDIEIYFTIFKENELELCNSHLIKDLMGVK